MKRFWFLVLVSLFVVALLTPRIIGAWFLNATNADIAHALSSDESVQRDELLNHAQAQLDAAKSSSDDERITLAQARLFLARGDDQRAMQMFDQANASLRSDSIARFVWGQAAWDAKQKDSAFDHWRVGGAFVYFSQNAHRAVDKHDWQEGARLARIAIGIDPMSADMHYVSSFALASLNPQDSRALDEVDLAIQLAQDDELLATYLTLKGEILNGQGNWQMAMNVFDTARSVAPLDARPRTDLAMLWLKRQPHLRDDAIALLTQVVNDSPWYTAAYIALADLSEKQGDVKLAEAWLKNGLARNPNNADMLFALGKFYARHAPRRTDDARTMLTQAQKIETRIDIIPQIQNALADLGVK